MQVCLPQNHRGNGFPSLQTDVETIALRTVFAVSSYTVEAHGAADSIGSRARRHHNALTNVALIRTRPECPRVARANVLEGEHSQTQRALSRS